MHVSIFISNSEKVRIAELIEREEDVNLSEITLEDIAERAEEACLEAIHNLR